MALMCSKTACQARRGMCIHEKAMVGMMLIIIFGLAGHWLFHWF